MTSTLSEPVDQTDAVAHSHALDGDLLTHEIRVGDAVHRSSIATNGETGEDLQALWWKAYLAGETAAPSEVHGTVRAVELFSASGGLALGFSQACRELGLRVRSEVAVDQDAEALAIYRRHNQTRVVNTKSVSTLVDYRVRGQGEDCVFVYDPEILDDQLASHTGAVDVLLAGPPCQGHSNLNNQSRRNDKRNELYLTVPAIAVALQANAVIIENVQAAVHDRRRVVQSAIRLLGDAGYHVTTGVLKAAELGWPQRRDRFFVVARKDRPPLDLGTVANAFRHEALPITWAIGDLEDAPADDFMSLQPEFSEENLRRIDWLFDNDEYDLAFSQRPECHKGGTTYNSVYGRLYPHRPAPTITTGFMTPGRGRYIHPTRRRVLTPREAARLQGFPDTYDFRPSGATVPSKLKLGKWIGDAVPMPLGYAAGIAALGPGWPPMFS